MREKRGIRRLCVLAAALFVAALFLAPAGASAATITVTGTDDLTGSLDDPGLCNLRDAVTAANTNAPFSECPGDNGGGTGDDTILLQGGQTYKLTNHATPEDANVSGDLDITGGGVTTIRSTGSGLATIDADSDLFPGPAVATRGRALDISSGAGGVTLNGIRIKGGMVTDGLGGGGIKTFAPLTLNNSEVTDNFTGIGGSPGVFGGFGGGIEVEDPGGLTMTGSTVANNRVRANKDQNSDEARGGGIFYHSFSHPFNATNSTISGNVVDSQNDTLNTTFAGGIYWEGLGHRSMNLTNVTISNNSAIDSVVGGDTAHVSAGGIVIFEGNDAESDTTIKSSIIAGNTAPLQADCGQVNLDDDFISAGNNVFGDFSGCGHTGGSNDAFFANPTLGPLSNYGGLTRTQTLNPSSPAIDRGGTCPDTDQRGFFRFSAPPCDAGAVELNASITPPAPPAGSTPPSPAGQSVKKCKKKKHERSAAEAKKCNKKK